MANRINPGRPPSERPGRQPDDGKSPLDRVAKISRPLKEMLRQQGIIGPQGDNGAFYDLMAIHRAAVADPDLPGDAVMSPLEFTADHDHAVSAIDDSEPGRFLVDRHAAFSYVQEIDPRVQIAVGEVMASKAKAAVEADPIQAGVDSCKGGPYGLMVVALNAIHATGQTQEDYFAAVMDRARKQAAGLDPIAAESLVESVRSSIEGCPNLREVAVRGFDPEAD